MSSMVTFDIDFFSPNVLRVSFNEDSGECKYPVPTASLNTSLFTNLPTCLFTCLHVNTVQSSDCIDLIDLPLFGD